MGLQSDIIIDKDLMSFLTSGRTDTKIKTGIIQYNDFFKKVTFHEILKEHLIFLEEATKIISNCMFYRTKEG